VGDALGVRQTEDERPEGGGIRPGRRSDVDAGGLSPRASSRKGRRWNGRVDGRGGTIDNVIFETLIISAVRAATVNFVCARVYHAPRRE